MNTGGYLKTYKKNLAKRSKTNGVFDLPVISTKGSII